MRKVLLAALAVLITAAYCVFLYACPRPSVPVAQTIPTMPATEPEATEIKEETIPEETEPETLPVIGTVPVSGKPAVDPEYQLTARNAFVYHCTSGELLFTRGDMQKQIAPASLTKLFTAYVALQYLEPDMVVTCGKETTWIDPVSSVAWVGPGDRVTVELLVQGMMMQSGNDAAYATAVAAGRILAEDPEYPAKQAVALFMDEVNRQAQKLGLTGTHFATPDGVDTADHYTTASDMLSIALLVMEHPLLRHYTSLYKTSVMYENGETHTYQSTNYLLQPNSKYYCADACGMKTGTTRKAGSCLMSLFHNGEDYILIGIFGCPKYEDRFADALQLYALYGGTAEN